MSSMKHTKSPSGRTHRLTDEKGTSVVLRYQTKPRFDDQVQGDLIRAYREKTGSGRAIGILPVHVDAALLDADQTEPSLDFLRGYLAGLEEDRFGRNTAIQKTREQIARLEAAQRGYQTAPVNVGRSEPREKPNRLSAGVAAVKEAEARGW